MVDYEFHKADMARRQREATALANEIGKLPRLTRAKLRSQCEFDLKLFLTKCFPSSTSLKPFCVEQLQVIDNIQEVMLNGGYVVNALPRGFVKSSITARAALWGVLYGHCGYVVCYAATKPLALVMLNDIKTELRTNPILMGMFPEVCYPIKKLDNTAQRAKRQTYQGKPTAMTWKDEGIVLPTMPDYVGSGAIIECKAVLAARGLRVTDEQGNVRRPDVNLFDDPQTDEEAENPHSVRKIINRIKKGCLMGAGHATGMSAVMNVTVIEEDDVAEFFLSDPNWVAVRYQMMKSMPTHLEEFWLGEYAETLHAFDKTSSESQQKAREKALALYKRKRAFADAGADATWQWCYKFAEPRACEISAIQHAMNLLIEHGLDTFNSECQNQPGDTEDDAKSKLTWKAVLAKSIDLPKEVVPQSTQVICGHIDVHESVLAYTLIAFNADFGGHVTKWGTWPEQSSPNFQFRKAKIKIPKVAPAGSDIDGAIYYAVTELLTHLFTTTFETEDGGELSVDAIGIDIGDHGDVVRDAIRNSPYRPFVIPMKGHYIGPGKRKISEWKVSKGAKRGEEWVFQRPVKQAVRQITFDSNYWKSRVKEAWLAPTGNRFTTTIHKGSPERLRMFCQQASAEKPTKTMVDGKYEMEIWTLPPSKPDNHFGDNVVGSFVVASYKGLVRNPHLKKRRTKRRQKVTL